jgi:hypothetical protein
VKQGSLALGDDLGMGAEFSDCGTYRYALWRTWNALQPGVLFVGLNPSTADATTDDPTIRRCIGFAKRWGYGGITMANVFAYRATDPREMTVLALERAIGPENDAHLASLAESASFVVAAWGAHLRGRDGPDHRDRVDRPQLEPDARLLEGQPRLRALLRRDAQPPLQADARSPGRRRTPPRTSSSSRTSCASR